jgi:hypothetical protein
LTHITKRHLDRGMQKVRDKIESFGVKLSPTLEPDSTTHIVGRTRNTPPILEGLVRGKYIVAESYMDALVAAMTAKAAPGSTNTQVLKSPLEIDFDGNLPDPMEHVPPPGKEPQPRPSEFLRPSARRANVFEGVSFIFYEEDQLNTLRRPIEVGKGKTMLYPNFTVGATTAENISTFFKTAKSLANGQASIKVVVVRPPLNDEPGSTLEWKRSFLQAVDLTLGQRSIVQNELLDAILTCDIDALCQPLQDMSGSRDTSTRVRPSQQSSGPSNTQSRSEQPQVPADAAVGPEGEEVAVVEPKVEQSPSKPSKSQRFRFTQAKSRFKGFDDFDDSVVPSIAEGPDEPSDPEPEAVNQAEEHEPEPPAVQTAKRNKRSANSAIEILLPAAAAVKRRKVQTGNDQDEDELGQEIVETKPSRVFRKKTIRPAKDDNADVMDAARAMREHEQEQARLDEEVNGRPLEQEEVSRIREQIVVAELPIRVPLSAESANARWNDQWNGRQNFKKFRRKGSDGPQPLRGHRVIVRLEEAKKRDLTLGAVRWAAASTNLPDSPSTARDVDDEEDESQFRRRSRAFADEESRRTSNESQALDTDDVVVPRSASGNAAASMASSVTRGTKRSATSRISPPAKRASNRSQKARAHDSSEGSEDDLRFKFSKRRGRAK